MSRRNGNNPRFNSNFTRSRAASAYYSHGTSAAKVTEKRDEVSLKYYEKMQLIENRSAARGSVPKIICALIVCSCAIAIVFARSKVYNYQLANSLLTTELEETRETTASIIAQSTEKIDMSYIESEAAARLNMAKPQSYQIVYIEIPKTDYAVMREAQTVIEKEKPSATYKNIITEIKEAGTFLIKDKTD